MLKDYYDLTNSHPGDYTLCKKALVSRSEVGESLTTTEIYTETHCS